jgi:hypothetical protein
MAVLDYVHLYLDCKLFMQVVAVDRKMAITTLLQLLLIWVVLVAAVVVAH